MSKNIFTVMRKELWGYFSNPTALIFLGSYLCASLFAFFWVEKFFSRDIADLRPLYEWMPLLLIFLVSPFVGSILIATINPDALWSAL